MKFLRTTDPRFHLVDLKVGVFLLTSLLGTLLVFGFIGWRWEAFTPSVHYRIEPASGQGILPGMTVKHRGFRVGKVSLVELDPQGRVHAELRVFRKYVALVREDTVARLMNETMIGDAVIDLLPGAGRVVNPGSTLPFERERSISEVTEKLRAEITPALAEIHKMMVYVNDPAGDVHTLIANLQSVSDTLREQMPPTLTAMRESARHSHEMLDYATDPQGDLRLTIEGLHGLTTDFNRRAPQILERIAATVGRLEKTTTALQTAVEESGPQIPRMVREGTRATESVTEVAHTLKGLWPLQPHFKKKREEPLTVHGVR